jgi:large subunit ribosomal protein L19
VHSPLIDRIETMGKSKIRRSKLFFLRGLRGKAAKLKEKRN